MTKCVFCDSNAIGGWTPPFAKAGICSRCMMDLAEKLAKSDKLDLSKLEGEVDDIKRGMR